MEKQEEERNGNEVVFVWIKDVKRSRAAKKEKCLGKVAQRAQYSKMLLHLIIFSSISVCMRHENKKRSCAEQWLSFYIIYAE